MVVPTLLVGPVKVHQGVRKVVSVFEQLVSLCAPFPKHLLSTFFPHFLPLLFGNCIPCCVQFLFHFSELFLSESFFTFLTLCLRFSSYLLRRIEDIIQFHAIATQNLCSHAVFFEQYSKDKVFNTDVLVIQTVRFFSGMRENPLALI